MRSMTTCVLLGLATVSGGALAQSAGNWPTKPVRMVLAFGGPGGAPDVYMRLIAPKLGEMWGQAVVVDPRSGAGGIIGMEVVAKAPADGYSYVMNSPAHVINPALYDKMPYDTDKTFASVSLMCETPNIVVIHPSVPARSIKELIAYGRANPGALNFGSAGNGSSQHLSGELFAKMANVKMTHVPYKSGPSAVTDLVGGRLQLTFGAGSSMPMVRAGKLIALGVTTARRSSSLPDIPTVAEAGLPGYAASAWYGLFAPMGTSKAILEKVAADTTRVSRLPEYKDKFAEGLIEPIGGSPAELDAFLQSEKAKWTVIVRESGARAN
jgi:tripartite-type tricarboxylate transporter receptor subunit TctC